MGKKKYKEGIVYYDISNGKSYQYIKKHDKLFLITTDIMKIWEEPEDTKNLVEK